MQGFIYDEDFVVNGTDYGYFIDHYSRIAGDYFEKIISSFIPSENELNMIKAMIIGRREGITSEMEYVYQTTGTSHILAVSGLRWYYISDFIKGTLGYKNETI